MQQKKMAAPCGGLLGRPVMHFLSCFSKTAARSTKIRHFSCTSLRRSTVQAQSLRQREGSPWTLMAAVCLQRLPVVSADLNPLEQRYKQMVEQIELERSRLSDHELRVFEEAAKMNRAQQDNYDSDEEGGGQSEDIVWARDLEDSWEQKLKEFEPASRDGDEDLSSVDRCLADSLVLLAEQQVGSGKLWLLPQAQWQEGETLRQTAERALASLPDFGGTFLSNAPCGVYKYKLPKAIRTDTSVGAKVFFFKAIMSNTGSSTCQNSSLMWLKKNELQGFLKPAYMSKVNHFIIDL